MPKNNEKTLILMFIAVLVYFISYFFLYLEKDSVNVLSVDYTTAFTSLIPVAVTIFIVKKFFKNKIA